jgi:hypothetical protein
MVIIPYIIDNKKYIYYSDILYEGQCIITSLDNYIPKNSKDYKLFRLNVYNYKRQKVVINALINVEIITSIGKNQEIDDSYNYLYNLIIFQVLESITDSSIKTKIQKFVYSGVMHYLFEDLSDITQLVHSTDVKRKFDLFDDLKIKHDNELKKYFTIL